MDVKLLAHSPVVWNSGICLATESTSQSLLLHRYLDKCEREHNQYFLVPLALQEEADQSIDFALSDTVRFLLKFCLAFLLDQTLLHQVVHLFAVSRLCPRTYSIPTLYSTTGGRSAGYHKIKATAFLRWRCSTKYSLLFTKNDLELASTIAKIQDLDKWMFLNKLKLNRDKTQLLYRGWKRNHESWIIVTKHVRIMNLCFKNLGIMNLCTSARESWITRLWEKLNKIHVWINCVRSRECRISWRFRKSNFQDFSWETCPRTPYIIPAFGADSPLVSLITLCLMFSHKKLHAKTKRMMIPESEWSRS